MRFCLIHVDEHSDEAVVIVPSAEEKTAIMVPVGALPAFLPILHEATQDLGEQCCPACSAALPGV